MKLQLAVALLLTCGCTAAKRNPLAAGFDDDGVVAEGHVLAPPLDLHSEDRFSLGDTSFTLRAAEIEVLRVDVVSVLNRAPKIGEGSTPWEWLDSATVSVEAFIGDVGLEVLRKPEPGVLPGAGSAMRFQTERHYIFRLPVPSELEGRCIRLEVGYAGQLHTLTLPE